MHPSSQSTRLSAWTFASLWGALAALLCVPVAGQNVGFGPPALATASVNAASGQPYGIATIEIPLRNPVLGDGPPPLSLVESPAPTFFPVSKNIQSRAARLPSETPLPRLGRGRLLNRVGNLIREIAGGEESRVQTVARRITFLFEGDQPFSVQLVDRNGAVGTFQIRPSNDTNLQRTLVSAWWADFTANAKSQIDATDTPPWVQTYLVGMLSGRFGLPLPDWYGRSDDEEENDDPLLMTLSWIGGAAKVSDRVFASAAAGRDLDAVQASTTTDVAAIPLPAPIAWQPTIQPLDPSAPEPEIEPLAEHVPPECFYIRYGKFENYLWFQDLTDEYGGDISRMVTLSGLSNDGSERLTKQLGIQMTAMGRMLGPSIITDQAIIGRDLYMQDGAAMGVVFEPTNAFLLRSSLNNDRTTLANSSDQITLKNVQLENGEGTLMRSTDNSVRSYMVEHDGYICITNCKMIAERFLEVGRTGESLGKTDAFRFARTLHPLSLDDTIFAYFSPEMLQGLLSPQYLIELRRRMQSEADIALVHLARAAAASHSSAVSDNNPPLRDIEPLVAAGYLPVGFGERPDGTGVFTIGDRVLDTRRGARGTFLPIPDSPVESVTATEAQWFAEIADAYSQQFRSFDPIFVGVKRELIEPLANPDGSPGESGTELRERLIVHAEVAPWQPESYGWWAEQLGPPTPVSIRFAPDDIVALQAHVTNDTLGPPTHLFAGIKDSHPPQPEAFDGILGSYQALKTLPGYLGAWPFPGTLDRLPLGLGRGQPVGPNMSRLLGGIYRYTGGEFSILSFQPDLLAQTVPLLAAEEVSDSAQLRAHIGNLKGSQLEGWVNEFLYQRASATSAAGAEFLATLSSQLGNAPEKRTPEDVLEQAKLILGGDVQCALGGTYRPLPALAGSTGKTHWVSTAWGDGNLAPPTLPPAEYQAPIMQWFRGADATVTQYENRLVADAVIEIARVRPNPSDGL
ncbi:hypothetical protein [Rhodopirellula sallentina]|nr:hypothetical protein [Rhodopirellula sallentina]